MSLEFLLINSDPDHQLSFDTKQQVNILDRWLGITFNASTATILAYIFIYVFWIERGYLEYEQARGAVVTHVNGDAISVSNGKPATRFFTAEDLVYPGMENGNVFVTTRMTVMKQSRRICEDQKMPCSSDADCSDIGDVQGTCSANGFCEEHAWCDDEEKPEQYQIDSGGMQIWAKSSIQFLTLSPQQIYSTENDHPYPELGWNTFTVAELLRACEPVPVLYEEVAELGAAIEVQLNWHCNVANKDCHPRLHAKRLDTIFSQEHIGFKFSYSEYVSETERVLNTVSGIRLLFRSSGRGRKVSVQATVQRFSLNSGLLLLAAITADLMMLKIFRLQKKYEARKYEASPDFSEYIDSLKKKREAMLAIPLKQQIADEEYSEAEKEWQHSLNEREF